MTHILRLNELICGLLSNSVPDNSIPDISVQEDIIINILVRITKAKTSVSKTTFQYNKSFINHGSWSCRKKTAWAVMRVKSTKQLIVYFRSTSSKRVPFAHSFAINFFHRKYPSWCLNGIIGWIKRDLEFVYCHHHLWEEWNCLIQGHIRESGKLHVNLCN